MTLILLILAAIVLFYLYQMFQEYMKNPYSIGSDAESMTTKRPNVGAGVEYRELSNLDKMKRNEIGIMCALLGKIANSDGTFNKLEQSLSSNFINDAASSEELQDFPDAKADLTTIFKADDRNVMELALAFKDLTQGEYKKRLKLVEFMLSMAYADFKLDEREEEVIIDLAAFLELENDDFNALLKGFADEFAEEVQVDEAEALKILGLSSPYTADDLDSAYEKLTREHSQNILENRNLDRKINNQKLHEINAAYKFLKHV